MGAIPEQTLYSWLFWTLEEIGWLLEWNGRFFGESPPKSGTTFKTLIFE
jgi:hypothetical protein